MDLQPLRITLADGAWHEPFFRYVSRVFPRADFRAWHRRGGWTSAYAVHALARGDEVVAASGVMRMHLVIDGREVRGAQLGAVGCVPELRGRGLVRPLLERVLAELDRDAELVMLYANERVLDFYPRFGFRRASEAAFELACPLEPAAVPAVPLDLDDASQRAAWLDACARSPPPTERFGARDYGAAALWHACNGRDVYALPEAGAYAIAAQEGDTLHLLDVAAPRPFELAAALPALIRAPAARVRFGFCPERWCPAAGAVGVDPERLLFVRGAAALPPGPFRFPALAET